MSVRIGHSNPEEPRLLTELDDGRVVEIDIVGSPSNKRRIDVNVREGRHWVFAVEDKSAGLILTLNKRGQRIDDDLPAWIEPMLQRLGLEGIEV